MSVERLNAPELFGTDNYSHAVRVGNLLFLSGASAREPDGSVHSPGDPAEQARYCFEKLKRVLEVAGCTFADVVKVTTYVTHAEHRPAITEVRRQYLTRPFPASTGVVVSALSDPALLFEIDAIAVIPEQALRPADRQA
jgi:enamine deaminase RidA (YjgF/YER057c/UK114 family)